MSYYLHFQIQAIYLNMQTFIIRTLLKGLSVIIPIILSAYILFVLVKFVENAAKHLLEFAPADIYFTGLGTILLFSLVFGIGLLMYPWITRSILKWLDTFMRNIPIFKSVYSPIKDMMSLMSGDISEKLGRPVFVKLPNSEFETLGFVTQDSESDSDLKDSLLVYVQMSYQIGGFTFLVPKDQVRDANMNVEQGIRWALTAGLSKDK